MPLTLKNHPPPIDKTIKNCHIPSSVAQTNDGIQEALVLTTIAFGVAFFCLWIIGTGTDDPAAGIKVSRGTAGPEYDHCKKPA